MYVLKGPVEILGTVQQSLEEKIPSLLLRVCSIRIFDFFCHCPAFSSQQAR
jgi:hypothetical protein